jgi:hypothetical protein
MMMVTSVFPNKFIFNCYRCLSIEISLETNLKGDNVSGSSPLGLAPALQANTGLALRNL